MPVKMGGRHLNENVLYAVPRRHYGFSIRKLLRIYFNYDGSLLGGSILPVWAGHVT